MLTRGTSAALGAALLLPLSACGTTDPSGAGDEAPAKPTSADCEADQTATSTEPVTITDAMDRTVELDKPAERVAVLEWQQTEDLLSLCVTPVAVADTEGYATWDTAETLPDGVKDVGDRNAPNVEAMLGTNPDLVVVEQLAVESAPELLKQLEQSNVPVVVTAGAGTDDPVQTMLDTFTMVAEATGRTERADIVVEEFEKHLAWAKGEVEAADAAGDEFVYYDGWIDGGNVAIRPFGQGSLIGELGEALGLKNAWTGKVDELYGLGQTDVEGMSDVGDATFFYTGTKDPAGDIVAELDKNQVWAALPAVEDGRVHGFPEGIWTFGGPRSSQQVLDAYVDLLTK